MKNQYMQIELRGLLISLTIFIILENERSVFFRHHCENLLNSVSLSILMN